MNPTLRTAKQEKRYQKDIQDGNIGDISELPAPRIGGLKIIENQYPYDAFYAHNDMLIARETGFWNFWVKLGQLIENGELDSYAQVIYNLPKHQSQPQIPHAHIVKFKNREDFEL